MDALRDEVRPSVAARWAAFWQREPWGTPALDALFASLQHAVLVSAGRVFDDPPAVDALRLFAPPAPAATDAAIAAKLEVFKAAHEPEVRDASE